MPEKNCSENERIDLIKSTALWNDANQMCISQESWEIIKNNSARWQYRDGQMINMSGDYINSLNFIEKGVVEYYLLNANGCKKIVNYTNSLLGIEAYFNKLPILYNAVASESVVLYRVDKAYAEIILACADIRDYIFLSLSAMVRTLGWQIYDFSFGSAEERICRLLCCFAVCQEKNDATYKVAKITHQEIAYLTGIHRVTASKALAKLKETHLIDMPKEGTIILQGWDELIERGFYDIL